MGEMRCLRYDSMGPKLTFSVLRVGDWMVARRAVIFTMAALAFGKLSEVSRLAVLEMSIIKECSTDGMDNSSERTSTSVSVRKT